MQRLRECAAWNYVAVFVAASMVVPYSVLSLPQTVEAQPQAVFGTSTVVVLPIRDVDGSVISVDSQKATDAMALSLEGSGEFVVTPKRALESEVAAMGSVMPLSIPEQVRLAGRLQVEKVLNGYLATLAVNEVNGQVRVRLVVEVLDIATGEFLDGADITMVTKSIPGWGGERNQVVNEALRQAGEGVVAHILMSRTPVGYVTSVASNGRTSVNIGAEDGVRPGTEMVVMRPIYQEDLDEVRLVKMGRIAVSDVFADMSWAAALRQGRAKVGDRVYALHMNVARVHAHKRRTGVKGAVKILSGVAAIIGLAYVATGHHTSGPPEGVAANLYQYNQGSEALIRVHVPRQSIPLTDQVFAWLFFRREGQQNFPLSAENLVAIWPEARLPNNAYDDPASTQVDIQFAANYQYVGQDGDEEDIDVDITYNHPPLVPNGTYFYRVQRITEPEAQAGGGAPITSSQMRPSQIFVPADIDVDPVEALSEGSSPTNGVTYFTPVTLQAPNDGAQNQSTTAITYSWATTLGANEYMLQVFPFDDPGGTRNPDYQVQERRDSAGTMTHTITATFAPSERYYWRVGARRAGEAEPQCGNQQGWLFSSMRTFTTAVAPPPPPGTSAAGAGGARTYGSSSGLPRYGH